MNRFRHRRTVLSATPSPAATSMSLPPSAQANTIRHRNASACAVV
jgi:hypothetical protein